MYVHLLAHYHQLSVHLVDIASFEALRSLMVTGAIFTPPMFEWAQDAFGKDVHVASGCGGTDVCTGCKLLFRPIC